jgi:hypothetical protein
MYASTGHTNVAKMRCSWLGVDWRGCQFSKEGVLWHVGPRINRNDIHVCWGHPSSSFHVIHACWVHAQSWFVPTQCHGGGTGLNSSVSGWKCQICTLRDQLLGSCSQSTTVSWRHHGLSYVVGFMNDLVETNMRYSLENSIQSNKYSLENSIQSNKQDMST